MDSLIFKTECCQIECFLQSVSEEKDHKGK